MRLCYLLNLSILLLAIFTVADNLDGETPDVDAGVSEMQPDELVPAREWLVYERPVPCGPTYFFDPFDTRAEFLKRWVKSQARKDGAENHMAKYDGQWAVDEPVDNPIINDLGLIMKSKAKHHAISSKLEKLYEFTGKPLIVQYEVKFQSGMDCGGAYIKLLSKADDLNLKSFTDKTPYTIMFGPDKCGNEHKLHFIFRHKNPKTGTFEEKHAEQPSVKLEEYFIDRKTHLFTLTINPDNMYEIKIDNKTITTGDLLTNFSPPVNPPKETDDPDHMKPDDWDNRERIPDANIKKPDDWDESEPPTIIDENAVMPEGWLEDEDLYIPDPDAVRADDWDVEIDGEWEAPHIDNPICKEAPGCGKWEQPTIANPNYRGIWLPPTIKNPDYNGEWKPRKIPNPDYFEDPNPYNMTPIEAVGLELWSMSDNILFDNFIIADNETVVEQLTAITWHLKHSNERSGSSTGGWWDAIRSSTAERPWLWVVYSIILVIPILILFICLCPKSGTAKPRNVVSNRKKFDYPIPDVIDPIKEEDEFALREDEEEEVNDKSKRYGGWKNVEGVSQAGAVVDGSNPAEYQAVGGADSQQAEVLLKKSGSPRKRATKKE